MKRLLHVISFSVLFSMAIWLYGYMAVFAQDFDYPHAYQDYQYNYQLYRTSHDEYVSAKSAYLSYKTLTAENTALEATRQMLKSRDEALRTYLTALRMKLKETTGILDYQQNLYFVKLDNENAWLVSHQNSLNSPLSLKELFDQSSQLESKYPTTELLVYQTLTAIIGYKENFLREKTKDEVKQIKDKLEEMKSAGEDTSRLEQWVKQAEQKIVASEEKQKQAEAMIAKIRVDEREKQKKFNEARSNFDQANQALKEGVSFLQEITREMKYE